MTTQERDKYEHAKQNAKGWFESIEEMLAALDKAEADSDSNAADEAMTAIHESPLSVMVRDGWRSTGQAIHDEPPEEYEILLSTGGPALRIWGKLDKHCYPQSAELQMQDWFIPWTAYECDEQTLIRFAGQFYFED